MYLMWDWTYILVLPGLILGIWAQAKVKTAYSKYSEINTTAGVRAAEVVRHMLFRNGNQGVAIKRVAGEMTDHYNPADNSLSLSDGVHDSASIAAIGIAAHEAGHAMQQLRGYAPLKLRTSIVPVVNIGSGMAIPIFTAGLIFAWKPLTTVGIVLFALSSVFSLITLPVEFNASNRAMQMLREGGYLNEEELSGARSVLTAAALTYVAAAVTSLLTLLRLILLSQRNDNSRRNS